MSNPVIFKDLPATFPEKDKNKAPAAVSSVVIHIVLVTTLIMIPLLMPQQIERWELMTLIAPLAPPPPPLPAVVDIPSEMPTAPAAPEIQPVIKLDPSAVIAPTEIPKEIARIIDDDVPVIGTPGVPGGITGGSVAGVLRSVLLMNAKHAELPAAAPPPPPPPEPVIAPSAPVRVGGNIQSPRLMKFVPPVYPKLAIKARVQGTVSLEAIVTADGTVDEIHIISGNPLLVEAAMDCVKQWLYAPTILNGNPVAVILTAKVNFELGPMS